MKPVGVKLDVEPTVGSDNNTIDLRLLPEVTEFEGFINYGSPIKNRNIVVTENVINYPVFSQRKVETSVSIYDGQTIALGGLIREDVQKVTDKTPLLGDIPLAGVLFRSQADKHIKRNLIIFVTAKLMDPAGQPLAAAAALAATSDEITDVAPAATDAPIELPLP
jgi:general secretion pathway protein D